MSKILSARYQKYKERIQKKPRERYQNLSEEEKKKTENENMVVNDIRISQKLKSKN